MKDIERKDLQLLSKNSDMSEKALNHSLREFVYPTEDKWSRFIQILLLTLGIGLMATGIVFFFAYNWDQLDKFIKLGLVQGLVVITIALTLILKIEPLYKNILLSGGAILVGVMFAVFGQVYQTGANAYDFFFAWTLFICLWVFISDFPSLWIFFLGLINLTIYLYWIQVARNWDFIYLSAGLFVLNGSVLLISAWLARQKQKKIPDYFTNLIAITTAVWSVLSNVNWIMRPNYSFTEIAPIIAASILFYAIGIRYGTQQKSVFYLGLIPFCLIIICSAALLRLNEGMEMLLIVTLFIITSVSAVIFNLIKIQRKNSYEK